MLIAKHTSPDTLTQIAIWTQGTSRPTYTVGRLNHRNEVITEIAYRSTLDDARQLADKTWLEDLYGRDEISEERIDAILGDKYAGR